MDKTIKITCQAADLLNINDLVEFQGELKSLHKNKAAKLRKSIEKYGITFPGFIWKSPDGQNKIIDSHQRLRVIKIMIADGWELKDNLFPVAYIDAKDEKEAKEKILLAASMYGEIDDSGLQLFVEEANLEIDEIRDIVDIPYIDLELEKFSPLSEGLTDDDAIPEPKNETTIKLGDMYQLGNHRVLCGDATKPEDVEKLMDGEKADMVFTDPPYGVSYADKNAFLNTIDKGKRNQKEIQNDHADIPEMFELWKTVFNTCADIMADKSSYYICSPQVGELMMMMMQAICQSPLSLKHTIIWVKNNHVLGRCDYHYKHESILYGWKKKGTHEFHGKGLHTKSTWEIPKPNCNDLHPTMKPVELMENAIFNSTRKEMIVFDCFLGSGSTLIACEKTGRKCYGMEIDPYYCQVILQRWENFTNERAVKL